MSTKVRSNLHGAKVGRGAGLFLVISLACILLLKGIDRSFSVADETIYVQVTQSIAEDGNFLMPTLGDEAFFNKPPLEMTLSAAVIHFFGDSNWAHRIVSVISGFLILLLVFLGSGRLFPQYPIAPFIAVTSLLGNHVFLFLNGVRVATLDSLFTLFFSLAMVSGVSFLSNHGKGWQELRSLLLFVFSLLLAFFAKGLPAMIAAGLLGLHYVGGPHKMDDKIRAVKRLALASISALVIIASYYSFIFYRSSDSLQSALIFEVLEPVSAGRYRANHSWFFFSQLFLTWRYFAPPLIALSLFYSLLRFRSSASWRFIFIWAVGFTAVFVIIPSRMPWYIMPALPAWAIMIGASANELILHVESKLPRAALAVMIALCVTFGVVRNLRKVLVDAPIAPIDQMVREIAKTEAPIVLSRPISVDNGERPYWNRIRNRIAPLLESSVKDGPVIVISLDPAHQPETGHRLLQKWNAPPFRSRKYGIFAYYFSPSSMVSTSSLASHTAPQ